MKHLICLLVLACLTAASNAETITVCLDGSCDYTDIQESISAASHGDTVIVYPGVYTSSHPGWVVDLQGKAITLTSLDPEDPEVVQATVIDGEDARRGVSCHSGETWKTIIRGFTIQNGYTVPYDYDGSGSFTYDEAYGGCLNVRYSSPQFEYCVFRGGRGYDEYINNAAAGYGAGCFLRGSSSRFEHCRIEDNRDGVVPSGFCAFSGSPTLIDCQIRNNEGYGVFTGQYGFQIVMERCAISGNSGRGLTVNYSGEASLVDCVIENNGQQGVTAYQSAVSLNLCVIRYNRSGYEVNTTDLGTITNTVICQNTKFQTAGDWLDGGGNTIGDQCPTTCIYDLSGDGQVDAEDLGILLAFWANAEGYPQADLNGDGRIDAADLGLLLGYWGVCQ